MILTSSFLSSVQRWIALVWRGVFSGAVILALSPKRIPWSLMAEVRVTLSLFFCCAWYANIHSPPPTKIMILYIYIIIYDGSFKQNQQLCRSVELTSSSNMANERSYRKSRKRNRSHYISFFHFQRRKSFFCHYYICSSGTSST